MADSTQISDLPKQLREHIQEQPDGCWHWTDRIWRGYGVAQWNGSKRIAHRIVYELMIGAIPDERDLDHLCHDPEQCSAGEACPHRRCVNPAHLEPVTKSENSRRAMANHPMATRTHCPRGHPYDGANTHLWVDGNGHRHRICRRCLYARNRMYRGGIDGQA